MAWSLIKPISPNFDHSNRFLTDYILQNFAFNDAYVATKNKPPLHAILQPRHPGVQFLKIIEWSLST